MRQKILVVDDEPEAVELVEFNLKQAGYDVAAASDGPEALKKAEVEVIISIMGIDDTSMQPVHARKRYVDNEILFGMRYADMLSTRADGQFQLDMAMFDEVVADERSSSLVHAKQNTDDAAA